MRRRGLCIIWQRREIQSLSACPDGGHRPALPDLPALPANSSSSTTNGSINGPHLADLSNLSSGSGRGLDRAIAAAERAVKEEDNPANAE